MNATYRGTRLFIALGLLAGCRSHMRVGSPQLKIQRAPEITCIVVVQSDEYSAEIAHAAIIACKEII